MRRTIWTIPWGLAVALGIWAACEPDSSDLGRDPDRDTQTTPDIDTDADTTSQHQGDTSEEQETDTGLPSEDKDGDGWTSDFDCDDNDPQVNPDEVEVHSPPNNIDEDCDGLTDEQPDGSIVLASFIWIANSGEGTVSKVDTRELIELGRYWVRPEKTGSPSRTSVNRNGDMVVASRGPGAVTMIRANTDQCVDSAAPSGIQTSSGPDDLLDWDIEECRGWYRDFSAYSNVRAIAWTSGEFNTYSRKWENAKVWVACAQSGVDGSTDVYLLNGEDGSIENSVNLSDVKATEWNHLTYGAVVDSENNMWLVQLGIGKLIRVDFSDLTYKTWDQPVSAYGISIDNQGRIWTCNHKLARFDPKDETWTTSDVIEPAYSNPYSGSCMADGNGTLWVSRGSTLVAVNTESMDIEDSILLSGEAHWGVALDVDGNVWSIPRSSTTAYRTDPATHEYEIIDGFVGAYTYSDMTGHLLSLVAPPVE